MHGEAMNAVTDLGRRIGDLLRTQAAVRGPPAFARIIGPESSGGRNGDEHPIAVGRILNDRVQTHPAGARRPGGPGLMPPQARELLPGLAGIRGTEKGRVFNPGIYRVGISQRRFEMPDALELPGARRAVVPEVRAGLAVVDELVPHRLPSLAPVVGALDQLPEPPGGLRRIEPIRIGRRSFKVVDLPAPKVRAGDLPAA